MPLPRFLRLPSQRQAALLEVAQRHLAREGRDRASYNQIIAEAGLSKTSAYLYFDGREDLVCAVIASVVSRLEAVLGAWAPVMDEAAFWALLSAQSERLQQHLSTHPEDLAIVASLRPAEWPQAQAWLLGLMENARALGVLRSDVPLAVMAAVTRAVLTTLDELAIEALREGHAVDSGLVVSLLTNLWRGAGR